MSVLKSHFDHFVILRVHAVPYIIVCEVHVHKRVPLAKYLIVGQYTR